MGAVIAVVLVVAFWALLWAGAIWVGPDTRDGRDWFDHEPVTGDPRRSRGRAWTE